MKKLVIAALIGAFAFSAAAAKKKNPFRDRSELCPV